MILPLAYFSLSHLISYFLSSISTSLFPTSFSHICSFSFQSSEPKLLVSRRGTCHGRSRWPARPNLSTGKACSFTDGLSLHFVYFLNLLPGANYLSPSPFSICHCHIICYFIFCILRLLLKWVLPHGLMLMSTGDFLS